MFSLRAEQYAAAYPKLVSEWSRSHGTLATGHQDNEERENPVGTSADLMKCFKYQDIPGIDKIGGDRPAERFYKVVSSAARPTGTARSRCRKPTEPWATSLGTRSTASRRTSTPRESTC